MALYRVALRDAVARGLAEGTGTWGPLEKDLANGVVRRELRWQLRVAGFASAASTGREAKDWGEAMHA